MTKKTVLFVAELGEGLGHVAPLKLIADKMMAQSGAHENIRPIFVVANSVSTRILFGETAYPILQTPLLRTRITLKSHSSSYAEILAEMGYSRGEDLTHLLAAWDDLFTLLKPDLIIADHSPTAGLAARGTIPIIATGNGYTLPPSDMAVFPALKAGMAPPTVQTAMLVNINSVLNARSQPTLKHLPELLQAEHRAVFTLKQLDPYGPIRHEPSFGSYHQGLTPSAPPAQPHLFLYLGSIPDQVDEIAQIVARSGAQISAYLGGKLSTAAIFLKNLGAKVYEAPPPLSEVLRDCSHVISHGGSGLANAALMVGRPQLIIPIHAESEITAGRIESLGAGLAVQTMAKKKAEKLLPQLLNSQVFADNAMRLAHEIASVAPPADPLAQVVSKANSLLRL